MHAARPLAALIAAAALASPPAALAGALIEGTDEETPSRILMEGPKVRIESGGQVMIFDGAAKRSLQIDVEQRTYTEFTKDDFAKMREMMKQAGASAPASGKPRSTRYEKTGKTEQALGKRCEIYRITEDGQASGEMCIAPFGTFGVQRADFEGFRAIGELATELTGGELDKNWADLPGVPLLSWDVEGGERRESFRATKVEKRSVPASEFAAPAGFERQPGFAEQMRQMGR